MPNTLGHEIFTTIASETTKWQTQFILKGKPSFPSVNLESFSLTSILIQISLSGKQTLKQLWTTSRDWCRKHCPKTAADSYRRASFAPHYLLTERIVNHSDSTSSLPKQNLITVTQAGSIQLTALLNYLDLNIFHHQLPRRSQIEREREMKRSFFAEEVKCKLPFNLLWFTRSILKNAKTPFFIQALVFFSCTYSHCTLGLTLMLNKRRLYGKKPKKKRVANETRVDFFWYSPLFL